MRSLRKPGVGSGRTGSGGVEAGEREQADQEEEEAEDRAELETHWSLLHSST